MEVIPKTKIKCPIAIELTVPENQLIEAKDKRDEGCFSQWFSDSNIPDLTYCIGIHPNHDDHKGETWIYFQVVYSKKMKTYIDFNIMIKPSNFVYKSQQVFENGDCIGKKYCTTDELFDPEKKFIVDGELTIKMDGFVMVEKDEVFDNKVECGNSSDSICLALWKQENKDFTILVEGKNIAAHKCILAARSPVFAKMFESGLKEAKEHKVVIEDFPFDIVEKAVKFCYHQSLAPHLTLDDKLLLLQFFDKYDIQAFKENLEKYLISVLNELTVCRLTNAALISNAPKLERKCSEFLRNCMKTKPIADFDLLDKDFAMNLLKNSFCHISDCENV